MDITKKRKNRKWTKKEELLLIKEFKTKTTDELAVLFDRPKTQIIAKISYMRKTGYPMGEAVRARSREVIENRVKYLEFIRNNINMKQVDIAKMLEISTSYVSKLYIEVIDEMKMNKITEAEIERRKQGLTEEEGKQLYEEKAVMQKKYDEILERDKVKYGVFKENVKVKLGQPYQIERVKKSVRDWNVFIGKCVHETKDHVTIKNKTRSETFLRVDFLIGEYRIKEIS